MNKLNRIIRILLVFTIFIPNAVFASNDGKIIITSDFESTWQNIFATGEIVEMADNHVYLVKDTQYVNKTENLKNYSFSFDISTKFCYNNFLLPSVQFRKTDDDNYYNLYFNALNSSISLERCLKGEKTPLGSKYYDFTNFEKDLVKVNIEAIDENIKVYIGENEIPLLSIKDAFPIGKGGIYFTSNEENLYIDNLEVIKYSGGISTFTPEEKEEAEKKEESEYKYGDIFYENNFDTGTAEGMKSYENKSSVVEFDSKTVYNVRSYDNDETTYDWTNYSVEFDVNIDHGDKGTAWPAMFARYASNGYRYDIYFDSSSESVAVERHQGNEKKYVGGGNVKFYQDSKKWVHIKLDVIDNSISMYYKDMNKPIFVMYDDAPIPTGGIGFGDGGSPAYYVDNIVARKIEKNDSLPSLEKEEKKTDFDQSLYKKEIIELMSLGFIQGDEKGNFNPEEILTRAEFAVITAKLLGIESEYKKQVYDDVTKKHFAFSAINAVSELGYMNGYDSKTFGPDDYLTNTQVASVLMNVLGYSIPAQKAGGYPDGYLYVANDCDLFNGLVLEQDEELTREKAVKIISNALDINIFSQLDYSSNPSYGQNEEETLLSSKHSIYKVKGLVIANSKGGIYGDERLLDDEIMLAGEKFKVGSTDISEKVAKYVVCYVSYDKTSEEKTVLYYFEKENKTKSTVVEADKISDKTNLNEFVYEDENGRLKTIMLSKNITLLVNGAEADYQKEYLMPENGKVTLISMENTQLYDVVLVESYNTMVAGTVSYRNMKIYDKYKTGEFISFEDVKLNVYKNGAEAEFNDIKAGDTLSIAKTPDGKNATIQSCDLKIQGTIKEMRYEDYSKVITIDSNEYKYSKFYQNLLDNGMEQEATVKLNVTYYLNIFGEISYSVLSPSNDFMLIRKIWNDEMDGQWSMDAMSSNGEWIKLSVSKTFELNDRKFSINKNFFNTELYNIDNGKMETIMQIALVKKNSQNEVQKIYTIVDSPSDSWPIKVGQSLERVEFGGGSMSFSNRSFIDSKTRVFVIPSNKNEKEQYSVKSGAFFKDGKSYSVVTYNEDEYEVASVVVVDESKAIFSPGKLDRPIIINKFLQGLDSSDELCSIMVGYNDSNLKEYIASDEKIFEKYNKGDVIRVAIDNHGKVVRCNTIYKVSSGREYSNNPYQSLSTDIATVKGDVLSYDASIGRIKLKLGTQVITQNGQNETVDLTKAYMIPGANSTYVFEGGKSDIELGSLSDIEPGDFIVMEYSWNSLRDIIIYKNLER